MLDDEIYTMRQVKNEKQGGVSDEVKPKHLHVGECMLLKSTEEGFPNLFLDLYHHHHLKQPLV